MKSQILTKTFTALSMAAAVASTVYTVTNIVETYETHNQYYIVDIDECKINKNGKEFFVDRYTYDAYVNGMKDPNAAVYIGAVDNPEDFALSELDRIALANEPDHLVWYVISGNEEEEEGQYVTCVVPAGWTVSKWCTADTVKYEGLGTTFAGTVDQVEEDFEDIDIYYLHAPQWDATNPYEGQEDDIGTTWVIYFN